MTSHTSDRALPKSARCVRWLEGVVSLAPVAARLEAEGSSIAWFDSGQNRPDRGAMSVLACCGPTVFATGRSGLRDRAAVPLPMRMREAFERTRLVRPSGDGFLGGWVGYVAYEAQVDFDDAFPERDVLLPYPKVWFRRAEAGISVDHDRHRTAFWGPHPATVDRLERLCAGGGVGPSHPDGTARDGMDDLNGTARLDKATVSVRRSTLPRCEYEEAVADIRRRIERGDVYQVNLTAPVGVRVEGARIDLFARLRAASPTDYAVYLGWPGLSVASSSPELFFSVRGRQLMARPMKGTRAEHLQRAEEELRTAEKDRAENLMIVDLLRNDIGRVAAIGTVRVPQLWQVERYATLYQMTSTVEAELRSGADVFDALGALFPPGSMTGAPKVQATRIIRELEPAPRGIYSGCIGFIGDDGDATFNVVIRTLVLEASGRGTWSVGGGVVADSEPEAEYEEALWKLAALEKLA